MSTGNFGLESTPQSWRIPRPVWPFPTIIATGMVGLAIVIFAFTSGGPCLGFFTSFFALVIWLVIAETGLAAIRPGVWADYQKALALLKQDPMNETLRLQALAIGREFTLLTVTSVGQPRYTETKVQNDLQATCAGH